MRTHDYREVTVTSDVCNEAENLSSVGLRCDTARTRQTTKTGNGRFIETILC